MTNLYIGECSPGMVAEPAHELAGVAVIVRVAPVRRVETQFPAVVQGSDVLVHRIDRLEYAAREFFELAQLDRFVHAVVLQIIDPVGRFEHSLSGYRQSVHVREFAFGRAVVVIRRPENRVEIITDRVLVFF